MLQVQADRVICTDKVKAWPFSVGICSNTHTAMAPRSFLISRDSTLLVAWHGNFTRVWDIDPASLAAGETSTYAANVQESSVARLAKDEMLMKYAQIVRITHKAPGVVADKMRREGVTDGDVLRFLAAYEPGEDEEPPVVEEAFHSNSVYRARYGEHTDEVCAVPS